MKAFNITFCILFIAFAGLQYNDPDPYIWVPIYLYSSWICYLAAKNRYYPKAILAGVLVYTVYAIYLVFDKTGVLSWMNEHKAENIAQTMKATKPWIEETREFLGLFIIIVVDLLNYFRSRKLAGA